MNPGWLLLGLAIVCEVAAALALRSSKGFTRLWPTVIALSAFATAFYAVSIAMKSLPVSVAYPVWAGAGTAGVALVGIVALKEKAGRVKVCGVIMIVTGIAILNAA